jgi:hypothetical protein
MWFHHFGIRGLQTSAANYNLRLVKAERAAREHGRVVLLSGPVIMSPSVRWRRGPEFRTLATPEQPHKAVVEPELEVCQDERSYHGPLGHYPGGLSRLPFVRVFCLETKDYVYADVDDVTPYEFDAGALARLHLGEHVGRQHPHRRRQHFGSDTQCRPR